VSDLKLFRIAGAHASEITGVAMALERPLQVLIERNMETFFGVRLVASEYGTGKKHGGRIDSLGLDENGSPVIFEYKRATNQNVINQGLFYLDWLLDHRAEFQLLVLRRFGAGVADTIDWTNPRLVCIAGDFTRYDEHAVLQINRSIELVRYRDYGGELLALELLTSTDAKTTAGTAGTNGNAVSAKSPTQKTVTELHAQASPDLKSLFDSVEQYVLALGDDVSKKVTNNYYAYRRLKNFACVEVHPQTKKLLIYVKTPLDRVAIEHGFTRDVTNIGHFGTGNLEITVGTVDDFERAKPLIDISYEGS
jgi:predicted transport protein